jgi:uncharacterized protein (TIGR03790 family)
VGLLGLLGGNVLRADTTNLPVEGGSGKTFQVPTRWIEADQLLVVANTRDAQSMDVADEYMARYGIPAANRFNVSFNKIDVIKDNDFNPVRSSIMTYLQSHASMQAIVVTWTEPWRVSHGNEEEGMGVTSAITFGFDPDYYNSHGDVCVPTAWSPFYDKDMSTPYTDYGYRPTMMLAGETEQDVYHVLDRSQDAKSTFPLTKGYLVRTTDDNRSVRYPQMVDADEFWTYPFALKIDYFDNSNGDPDDNSISDKTDVLYYFTGLATVAYMDTLTFVPGAVADHLTSYGGQLTKNGQMSILRWLEAGASGSYGTVAEPCNFTEKFTKVDMFLESYYSGVPLIEAYWQSVQQPGEGVFVGDPMAQPYAPRTRVNGAGQVELSTTGLPTSHVYKVTGSVNGGSTITLIDGVQVSEPQLRVLSLPWGFDTYKLLDAGRMYSDHGAPRMSASSVTDLNLGGGAWQFDIRATDDEHDQIYYSLQLANGKILSQSSDFTAEVRIDGDADGDGFVNFVDLGIVKGAMYSQVGSSKYVADADFNNDGVINFSDVAVIGNNFGGTRSFVRIMSKQTSTKDLVIMAFDKYGSESRMTVRVGNGALQIID